MRRTAAVIGVAGALILGQTAIASPAGAARNNCSLTFCSGGASDAPAGRGGAGGHNTVDPATGDFTSSGGGGAGGGPGFGGEGSGFGQHCDSDWAERPCVGGGSPN